MQYPGVWRHCPDFPPISTHEGVYAGSVIHSARTFGGGAGSRFPVAEQPPPHMFLQRMDGPCTRYRSAEFPPDVTARRTIAACNVARYSES